jgi:hypothetical protein
MWLYVELFLDLRLGGQAVAEMLHVAQMLLLKVEESHPSSMCDELAV